MRNDKIGVVMTVMFFNKELVLGGSFEFEFRLFRGTRLSFNVNLNS